MCVHVFVDDNFYVADTEDVVKEALASRVQSIPIQRKRNQTLLVDDYPVVSEDFVPVVHESKPLLLCKYKWKDVKLLKLSLIYAYM